MPTIATKENFNNLILKSKKPCFVRFGHDGCPLCANLKPAIRSLEEKYCEGIDFFLVDTTNNMETVQEYLDGGVPTIGIFNDGIFSLIPYPEEPHYFTGYYEEDLDEHCYHYLLSLEIRKLANERSASEHQKEIS